MSNKRWWRVRKRIFQKIIWVADPKRCISAGYEFITRAEFRLYQPYRKPAGTSFYGSVFQYLRIFQPDSFPVFWYKLPTAKSHHGNHGRLKTSDPRTASLSRSYHSRNRRKIKRLYIWFQIHIYSKYKVFLFLILFFTANQDVPIKFLRRVQLK